jgi:hypothetical protein
VARARKRRRASLDPLDVYKSIRKPMPPPEQVIPDKRREKAEREAEREAREAEGRTEKRQKS